MVKIQNNDITEGCINQGNGECQAKPSKIGPSTAYGYCSERMTPFGGLLGLIRFMRLVEFKEIFDGFYNPPSRKPKLGHYNMVYGLIMLLFIGLNRIWHFKYIQNDSMLCGMFNVVKLPYVTTYWRYVNSLGINQGQSLIKVIAALRERVWHLCELELKRIHIDIDTTVETVYGQQQGACKGHNTKNRGKEAFRPILGFISETREYILGKLRRGETISGAEMASYIRTLKRYIPECVQQVILRSDGEFISWESVKAAMDEGYKFIFANKKCTPPFDPDTWYKVRKNDVIEYNECMYKPTGWNEACRFVVMRIPKEPKEGEEIQSNLFEEDNYKYRVFVTNLTGRPHKVIANYDKRADAENLVGESKREGLSAIPSKKFVTNYAYFQIVMLAYNIWRWFKMIASHSLLEEEKSKEANCETQIETKAKCPSQEIQDNTIRIARFKLLLIAAKITNHSNNSEVKYSQHDNRAEGLFRFMGYLDERIRQPRPWLDNPKLNFKHLSLIGLEPASDTG